MYATIVSREQESITLQVTVPFSKNSMLKSEETLLKVLNETGPLATEEALKQFDPNGSPLKKNGAKWTTKGKYYQIDQTPYGEVQVERHVYQSSNGGETYCPLEKDARIVVTSTPRLAQMVGNKAAQMTSPQVENDLGENHGRKKARSC